MTRTRLGAACLLLVGAMPAGAQDLALKAKPPRRVLLSWPSRTAGERVAAVQSLVDLVAPGESWRSIGLGARTPLGTRYSTVAGAEWLAVTVDEPSNYVAVADTRVRTRWPVTDVGMAAAREKYDEVLGALRGRGLFGQAEVFSEPVVTLGRMGMGNREGTDTRQAVNEYRFTTRVVVDGYPVGNAGATIGISAEGQLASLAVGGAEVVSIAEADAQAVGGDDTARVVADLAGPGARLHVSLDEWMYVVPGGESRWVEPRRVVVYSRVRGDIAERGEIVAVDRTGRVERLSDPSGARGPGDRRMPGDADEESAP